MRKKALEYVYKLACKDKRITFVGSDLGYRTLEEYRREMPERFFMEGIAEQNLIGMAAGMAMEGRIVYTNTIATFITRRCYEQTVLDVAMHNLPVRLIGNGGGFVYAPLGPTHLATEDISIMRAIPNMAVVCPADANEMERFMPQTVDWPGPIYIRLGKGYDPIVTPDDEDFRIGKAVRIAEGTDVLLLTTGITLGTALKARQILADNNISTGILHCHTVKPFDSEALCAGAEGKKVVAAIEENSVIGGLGELAASLLMENGPGMAKFIRFGIPDTFPDQYGSQNSLLARYGIEEGNIADKILKALDK